MSEKREQSYEGELKKCPNCGANVKSFQAFCGDCGHEFRSNSGSKAIKEFSEGLEILYKTRDDKKIINYIQSFIIPNSKEDLLEFLILAMANIDTDILYGKSLMSFRSAETKIEKNIAKAWLSKYEQSYSKAEIILKNTEYFSQIELFNSQLKKKIKISKKKKRGILRIISKYYLYSLVFFCLLAISAGIFECNSSKIKKEIEQCISEKDYERAIMKVQQLYEGDFNKEKREEWIKLIKELEEKTHKGAKNGDF